MDPIIITGSLTAAAHKSHVPLAFDVPAGVTAIEATFYAAPDRARGALFDNMISLAVEGPAGFRGARHNNPNRRVRIGAAAASPGFRAGPIEPGRWTFWLDIFRLVGPEPVAYRLEIGFAQEKAPAAPALAVRKPVRARPGWYRGDLHAHSLHSDAAWSAADLAAWARGRGLDFATLTDHNTGSGIAEFEAAGGDGLLAMGGIELTSHFGHALLLGARRWREWRAGSRPGVTMAGLAEAANAAGEIFVIAHPLAPGDPSCTGCRWEHADAMPGPARLVEVWNGPWSDYNENGLAETYGWIADAWRREGRPMAITAGSDIHGPYGVDDAYGFNTVYAEALDEPSVLAAIGAGRNVLSCGPTLRLDARTESGDGAMVGESLAAAACALAASWEKAPADGRFRLLVDGRVKETVACGIAGTIRHPLEIDGPKTVTAELRDGDGRLLAITNPIFLAPAG